MSKFNNNILKSQDFSLSSTSKTKNPDITSTKLLINSKASEDKLNCLNNVSNSSSDGLFIWCYSCSQDVELRSVGLHLFFGAVMCEECGWQFHSCEQYSCAMDCINRPNFIPTPGGDCQHSQLGFCHPTDEYIKSRVPVYKMKKYLAKCMKYLITLKPKSHFKSALKECKAILDIEKMKKGVKTDNQKDKSSLDSSCTNLRKNKQTSDAEKTNEILKDIHKENKKIENPNKPSVNDKKKSESVITNKVIKDTEKKVEKKIERTNSLDIIRDTVNEVLSNQSALNSSILTDKPSERQIVDPCRQSDKQKDFKKFNSSKSVGLMEKAKKNAQNISSAFKSYDINKDLQKSIKKAKSSSFSKNEPYSRRGIPASKKGKGLYSRRIAPSNSYSKEQKNSGNDVVIFGKQKDLDDNHVTMYQENGWIWTMENSMVTLPENGNYLVLHEPLEACPMCYTELDVLRFSFNTSNWLLSVVCIGCDLTIFFLLKPPGGRDHKVQILAN